jgi:hypothetical protein
MLLDGAKGGGLASLSSPTGLWLDIALLVQRVVALRLKGKGTLCNAACGG